MAQTIKGKIFKQNGRAGRAQRSGRAQKAPKGRKGRKGRKGMKGRKGPVHKLEFLLVFHLRPADRRILAHEPEIIFATPIPLNLHCH